MDRLTLRLVENEIQKLAIFYRDSRSDADLVVLSKMWMEDIGHLSASDFKDSVRRVRSLSKWFPTTADILDAHRIIIEMRSRNRKRLPPPEQDPIDIVEMKNIRAFNLKSVLPKLKSVPKVSSRLFQVDQKRVEKLKQQARQITDEAQQTEIGY